MPNNLIAMKLSEITDTKRTTKITLPNGIHVSQKFFDKVKNRIEARIHLLDYDRMYSAKAICGKQFWLGLALERKGLRNLAGMCIKNMADNNEVELALVATKSASKRYRRRPN